jgi:hypothetical protein
MRCRESELLGLGLPVSVEKALKENFLRWDFAKVPSVIDQDAAGGRDFRQELGDDRLIVVAHIVAGSRDQDHAIEQAIDAIDLSVILKRRASGERFLILPLDLRPRREEFAFGPDADLGHRVEGGLADDQIPK